MHIWNSLETLFGLQTLSLSALSVSIAGWGFVEISRGLCNLSAAMNLLGLLPSQVGGCLCNFGNTYVAYVVDIIHQCCDSCPWSTL